MADEDDDRWWADCSDDEDERTLGCCDDWCAAMVAALAARSANAELVRLLNEAGKPAKASALAKFEMELFMWALEFKEAMDVVLFDDEL